MAGCIGKVIIAKPCCIAFARNRVFPKCGCIDTLGRRSEVTRAANFPAAVVAAFLAFAIGYTHTDTFTIDTFFPVGARLDCFFKALVGIRIKAMPGSVFIYTGIAFGAAIIGACT